MKLQTDGKRRHIISSVIKTIIRTSNLNNWVNFDQYHYPSSDVSEFNSPSRQYSQQHYNIDKNKLPSYEKSLYFDDSRYIQIPQDLKNQRQLADQDEYRIIKVANQS